MNDEIIVLLGRHQDLVQQARMVFDRIVEVQNFQKPVGLWTEPDYYEYLKSPEWLAKAHVARAKAGYRCQVCGDTGVELHVHHNTYERLGRELPTDLVCLCATCHKIFHDTLHPMKEKVPDGNTEDCQNLLYCLPCPEKTRTSQSQTY